MAPVLCQIGPVSVYTYGVVSALALILAVFLAVRRAPVFGYTRAHAVDAVFLLFIFGIVGSRLFFVLQHADLYRDAGWRVLDFREGGLVWYGGFLIAFTAAFGIVHFFRWERWGFGDFIAPILAGAHGLGRVGCFLNGCCYGAGNQPVQLYEAAFLGGLSLFLWIRTGRQSRAGDLFLIYVLAYSMGRFVFEFLRADQEHYALLTIPQLTSLILFGAAVVTWRIRHARRKI